MMFIIINTNPIIVTIAPPMHWQHEQNQQGQHAPTMHLEQQFFVQKAHDWSARTRSMKNETTKSAALAAMSAHEGTYSSISNFSLIFFRSSKLLPRSLTENSGIFNWSERPEKAEFNELTIGLVNSLNLLDTFILISCSSICSIVLLI